MNSKAATTEKLRVRYQMDLQELQNESERINAQAAIAEKKLQTFDKVGVKCHVKYFETNDHHYKVSNFRSPFIFALLRACFLMDYFVDYPKKQAYFL